MATVNGSSGSGSYDAIVIGSGPNGLGAAIELARSGRKVVVYEAMDAVGGGMRSAELTEPGFVHDHCATVLALAYASPLMRGLPLEKYGLELIQPECPVAHPLDDGSAILLKRKVAETAAQLGRDADAYLHLFEPLVKQWKDLAPNLLAPPIGFPKNPLLMASFGLKAVQSARALVQHHFHSHRAKALFGGMAGHSVLPMEWRGSGAFGLVLTLSAHADGWPIAKGGTQALADAMAGYFKSLGGTIELGRKVTSLKGLPPAKAILADVAPDRLADIATEELPAAARKSLANFNHGPGAFKLDWALSGPVPWKNADVARAATVHLAGTFDELAEAELAPWQGKIHDRPYVLLVQPTLFDPSRAPAGKHTLWAYCHVPNGSTVDMTDRIEAQIERFAPGFRDVIIKRHVSTPQALEAWNPNLVGGDIVGGAQTLWQTFFRPVVRLNPYKTPVKGLYLCSASTPPGAGVHGMSGYHAARTALRAM
ncbi:MAG TPA: NAD(P)/FAD-dependent oxidoreductase [Humisphaera sp.]